MMNQRRNDSLNGSTGSEAEEIERGGVSTLHCELRLIQLDEPDLPSMIELLRGRVHTVHSVMIPAGLHVSYIVSCKSCHFKYEEALKIFSARLKEANSSL